MCADENTDYTGQTGRVVLCGEVDARTFQSFEAQLDTLLKSGCRNLIVDCAKLSYMSSAGIGVLVNAMTEITDRRGSLVLLTPNERVTEILDILSVRDYFRIAYSEDEAQQHIAG